MTSKTKTVLIMSVLMILLVLLVTGMVHQAKKQVRLGMDASIECRAGHKWIRDRNGQYHEWINPDGTRPMC